MRLTIACLATILAALWLTSLPVRPPADVRPLAHPHDVFVAEWPTPSWRDTVLLQLRIDAPGLQQHRGLLTWSQGQGRPHQFEFTVLANGQPQRLVLPVGAHPGWQGDVRAVQLYLSDAVAAETTLLDAQVVTRPP